ncbi:MULTISPECIES: elongation factor P 5-aminopentanone reductase [unclassified Clostridioides]|uniref:elongation factor P 5-aminopentanone reductase n=1 Tax=unclassified Clostridioides TaxID=2635829 RepID=UPI001D0C3024|nr:SDR family oxidoreductase [Clostridioides sp. ES-S-0001-02]MCC0656994.1 SDR family oxidoreductase [Clostridioides sp. ES-S-0123-01]MCC0680290.1 SDR family oxidoreductase [Clostridioides sp. ES-S-0005-03]MCC0695435.1 SDR family oxidoreductase [Clostridioides sp. ES-S-0048-02]MCC0761517.1 SDR family oxidoreductase [Clostridioides sp. ES-S-0006-03]UDN46515.1 SDR family oxidoreductase [Clostridioides sp. ES-S-0173-01]UDN59509.1 SDR family oxidoreductase [Clostridioides sp. ES-S-0010-02]UDN609
MNKNNKTVLVTGGSRGIGRAISKIFAKDGYNVLINFNKSENEAKELYTVLNEKGFSVKLFKANISNREEVENMIDYCIKEFGGLDVLINNAGISQDKLFTDITDEDWDNMMNINLKGSFYCSQIALKYMISEKKGNIINISSIWGISGASCEVHYSVSKAGIIGMTKALAKEVAPSNIRVNSIAPGVINTDMLSEYNEDEIDVLVEETPLMRLGTPEDIANCAIFLASDKSSFITGQVISPNGGFVI